MLTFGLFQHTFIPDHEHIVRHTLQGVDLVGGLLPQPFANQGGGPVGGAQQIAETLGAGWGIGRSHEIPTEFTEEQAMIAVPPDEDRRHGSTDGPHEPCIQVGVEAPKERS